MKKINHSECDKFGFVNCRSGLSVAPVFNYVWQFHNGLAGIRFSEEQLL